MDFRSGKGRGGGVANVGLKQGNRFARVRTAVSDGLSPSPHGRLNPGAPGNRFRAQPRPSGQPSADPRAPGFHLRLKEGHILGILEEEVCRYQALSRCLQAGVISPSQKTSPWRSRSKEGLQLLMGQLDFEFRMEGEELWGEGGSWSGYCLHLRQVPELLGQDLREKSSQSVP